jgi:hypothetical protein
MPDEDQGRWLSYQALGDLFGCTANAARMHAVRRNWPRRSPNRVGDCATVLVRLDPLPDRLRRRQPGPVVLGRQRQRPAPYRGAGHSAVSARAVAARRE